MQQPVHRRQFLRAAGLVTATSMVWPLSASPRSGDVIGGPRARLLPGCCAYSYGPLFKKKQMTMEQFIGRAVELDVLGVDLTTYWLESTEPAYLATLRSLAYRNGMAFSGLAIGADLCQPDLGKRKQTLQTIREWVDATELVGATHLRVFGDRVPEGATEKEAIQWVAETLKSASTYAAGKGVILGLETHDGLSIKAANIIEILERVGSAYAGCNLDISNFKERPYEHIEACLPYATHVHVRDFYGQDKTPLDLDRVWQLFVKSGYKGYVSAEYAGEEDPTIAVPKLVGKIKALCRKYQVLDLQQRN